METLNYVHYLQPYRSSFSWKKSAKLRVLLSSQILPKWYGNILLGRFHVCPAPTEGHFMMFLPVNPPALLYLELRSSQSIGRNELAGQRLPSSSGRECFNIRTLNEQSGSLGIATTSTLRRKPWRSTQWDTTKPCNPVRAVSLRVHPKGRVNFSRDGVNSL